MQSEIEEANSNLVLELEAAAAPTEEEWNGVDEIESLCMRCGENGMTRLKIHTIPYFRQLILASFSCDECGERNNEVTFGGEIQLQGCVYELTLTTRKDLDRQLIKSDSASFKIPEIDFEIPPMTQKGEISTIEGFLSTAAKNLSLYQDERIEQAPDIGAKVADIILALTRFSGGTRLPFKVLLDDPSGNSFIENPFAPANDPCMKVGYYYRSPEQDAALGIQTDKGLFKDDRDTNYMALMTKRFGADIENVIVGSSEITTHHQLSSSEPTEAGSSTTGTTDTMLGQIDVKENMALGRSEAVSIPSLCPSCSHMGESLTVLTDIPHFKEVIIMAFNCSICGFRNSEVKGGGAVPTLGTEIELTVRSFEDLKRDVLKSDSAMMLIPELDIELGHGTLGGVYTTVEGLLIKMRNNLRDSNPFAIGDSLRLHHSESAEHNSMKQRFEDVLDALSSYSRGENLPFTILLRDPLGNSFVSAPIGSFLPPESDPCLKMSDFVRSYEENEEYGLNDINTRDFETGVDYPDNILPDRLTHVVVKGADHPSFFAKGIDDATPGGACLTAVAALSEFSAASRQGETEGDGYWDVGAMAGWVAVRPGTEKAHKQQQEHLQAILEDGREGEDDQLAATLSSLTPSPSAVAPTAGRGATSRSFDPSDFSLAFDPREEFAGRRPGFVFRMGAQGLGYYEERRKVAFNETSAHLSGTVENMRS